MTTIGARYVNRFLLNCGKVKHLTYILIHSTKKQDVTKCTYNCTIALFPHANKILPRIVQTQLQSYIGYETPMEQALLREGCAAREQIASVNESWGVQGSITKT